MMKSHNKCVSVPKGLWGTKSVAKTSPPNQAGSDIGHTRNRKPEWVRHFSTMGEIG